MNASDSLSEPDRPAAPRPIDSRVELEEKIMYQQRALDQLNGVVLKQQTELEGLRRELTAVRRQVQGLIDRGVGEDLPHEKPPHY